MLSIQLDIKVQNLSLYFSYLSQVTGHFFTSTTRPIFCVIIVPEYKSEIVGMLILCNRSIGFIFTYLIPKCS